MDLQHSYQHLEKHPLHGFWERRCWRCQEQSVLLNFRDLGRFDITSDIHQCSLVTVLTPSGFPVIDLSHNIS